MTQSLEDDIVLITGASRGIGLATALELGRRGAFIVGTSTSTQGAQRLSDALKANGVQGKGTVLDVNDATAVEQLLTELEQSCGAPSILVNNAGITRDSLLLRMKEEDWDVIMHTNLKAVFRLSKACLRPMTRTRKGRIINISSVVGATGNPGQTNYAAAKAGIIGFTRSLAREVAARHITVNVVAPGLIDTDMTRALPHTQQEVLLQQIPLGRLGLPEEVAYAVAFFASPQAAYITGVTLHVNGGMYMN